MGNNKKSNNKTEILEEKIGKYSINYQLSENTDLNDLFFCLG